MKTQSIRLTCHSELLASATALITQGLIPWLTTEYPGYAAAASPYLSAAIKEQGEVCTWDAESGARTPQTSFYADRANAPASTKKKVVFKPIAPPKKAAPPKTAPTTKSSSSRSGSRSRSKAKDSSRSQASSRSDSSSLRSALSRRSGKSRRPRSKSPMNSVISDLSDSHYNSVADDTVAQLVSAQNEIVIAQKSANEHQKIANENQRTFNENQRIANENQKKTLDLLIRMASSQAEAEGSSAAGGRE